MLKTQQNEQPKKIAFPSQGYIKHVKVAISTYIYEQINSSYDFISDGSNGSNKSKVFHGAYSTQ